MEEELSDVFCLLYPAFSRISGNCHCVFFCAEPQSGSDPLLFTRGDTVWFESQYFRDSPRSFSLCSSALPRDNVFFFSLYGFETDERRNYHAL